jgi:hypothetical protein
MEAFVCWFGLEREQLLGHDSRELDIWVNLEDRHKASVSFGHVIAAAMEAAGLNEPEKGCRHSRFKLTYKTYASCPRYGTKVQYRHRANAAMNGMCLQGCHETPRIHSGFVACRHRPERVRAR